MILFNILTKKYKILFFTGIIFVYVLTAYKSAGFHHPDEHFQIIEFAQYKMGETPAHELAWEFDAGIRSTLQPSICFLFFKLLRILQISDPYTLAFALRFITALFTVYILYAYTKSQLTKIDDTLQGVFIILSFLLWVIPYVGVRFSSETWSGLFFLWGIVQLKRKYRYTFLSVGLLWGIAILFRYQSAIMVLGATAWLLVVKKVGLRPIVPLSLGVLFIMLIGFGIDSWFYKKSTLTAYNYFQVNIVDGVASHFGVSPWYTYIWYILQGLGYPLGVFALLSLSYMVIYRWKEKEVWIIVPFILIHSFIPHKESRFLFPIAFYSGFVMTCFIQYLYGLPSGKIRPIMALLLTGLLIVNTMGLTVVCNKAAGNGQQAVGTFIHHTYRGEKVNVLYLGELDGYEDWPFSRNTFYRNHEIHFTQSPSIWHPDFRAAIDSTAVNLLMLSSTHLTGTRSAKKIADLHFKPIFHSIPTISQFFLKFYIPNTQGHIHLYERQKNNLSKSN